MGKAKAGEVQSKRKTTSTNRDDNQKQKSRVAAKNRRKNENDQFEELVMLNPWIKSNPPDKSTVIRLSTSWIGLKHVLNGSQFGSYIGNGSQTEAGIDSLALEVLDGFIIILSKDGRVIYINEKVVTYLGYPHTELLGRSIYNFVLKKDWTTVAKMLKGPLPDADNPNIKEPVVEDGDEICDISDKELFTPYFENDSKDKQKIQFTVRMQCSLIQRSSSKQSNFRVLRFTGVIKTTGDFVGLVQTTWSPDVGDLPVDHSVFISHLTPDLKLLYCEGRIHRYMDSKASDIVGRVVYPFYHPQDLLHINKMHSKLLATGQCKTVPYRWLNKDGGWVWLESKVRRMYCEKTGRYNMLCVNYVLSAIENKGVVVGLNPPTKETLIELDRRENDLDSNDARVYDPEIDRLAKEVKECRITETNDGEHIPQQAEANPKLSDTDFATQKVFMGSTDTDQQHYREVEHQNRNGIQIPPFDFVGNIQQNPFGTLDIGLQALHYITSIQPGVRDYASNIKPQTLIDFTGSKQSQARVDLPGNIHLQSPVEYPVNQAQSPVDYTRNNTQLESPFDYTGNNMEPQSPIDCARNNIHLQSPVEYPVNQAQSPVNYTRNNTQLDSPFDYTRNNMEPQSPIDCTGNNMQLQSPVDYPVHQAQSPVDHQGNNMQQPDYTGTVQKQTLGDLFAIQQEDVREQAIDCSGNTDRLTEGIAFDAAEFFLSDTVETMLNFESSAENPTTVTSNMFGYVSGQNISLPKTELPTERRIDNFNMVNNLMTDANVVTSKAVFKPANTNSDGSIDWCTIDFNTHLLM